MDHLTSSSFYDCANRGLGHLTSQKGLYRYLESFILSCRVDELSDSTISDYSYKIGRFIKYCIATKITTLEQITAQEIRLFILELQAKQKPVSTLDYYKCIKRFFNWLLAEELIIKNPMQNIRAPKIPKMIIPVFTEEHINNMLRVCDDDFIGSRNRAIILILLDTGLRRSELAGMKLEDVDVKTNRLLVMGKGAKQRMVRICPRTMQSLLKYVLQRNDTCPNVWVNQQGEPFLSNGIGRMIERVGKRAGVTGVRCSAHTFRHTAATWSLIGGAREFQVQSMLGHSTLKMTKHYTETLASEDAAEAHKKFSPVENMRL